MVMYRYCSSISLECLKKTSIRIFHILHITDILIQHWWYFNQDRNKYNLGHKNGGLRKITRHRFRNDMVWTQTEFPKRVLYINLETTRFRGRPKNRWQDEVREDGRIAGGEGWQEKPYNREESKMLLRKARNCHILYMPMEWMMNEWMNEWYGHSKTLINYSGIQKQWTVV